MELQQGHTHEAKRPRPVACGFDRVINDRMLIRVWEDTVQYDSPSVRDNQHYPTMTMDEFLQWAGRDVTAEMPKGDWRPYSN